METTQIVTVVGFLVSIFTILFGIVALMWQINSQSNRLEAKIDAQGTNLESKIDAQGKELRDEIKEQGTRVSQAELDQARLNGVNSVLLRHTHTHESVDDDD